MYVHWKSLLILGLILWLSLCATDLLGEVTVRDNQNEILESVFDNTKVKEMFDKKVEQEIGRIKQTLDKSPKYGLLFVYNTMAFIFSIAICTLIRNSFWKGWQKYLAMKKLQKLEEYKAKQKIINEKSASISKIPILYSKYSAQIRASDPNIKIKNDFVDSSCPNLNDFVESASEMKLFGTNQLKEKEKGHCEMIFKNDLFLKKSENNWLKWQSYCAKLRDEMLKAQATSLREHANLSRKLDAISKEKKEIAKQLTFSQKENRGAKAQIEELIQEKQMLLKRLETATKEFRVNTKSKKMALAQLDEVSSNVDSLKSQLEQVSRDKEILQNKFRVLEEEYFKMQERLVAMRLRRDDEPIHGEVPERDLNSKNIEFHDFRELPDFQENVENDDFDSNSNEINMKKIEIKIQQLEKSLENFNSSKIDFTGPSLESDISSSVLENTESDTKVDYMETTDKDTTSNSSPRFVSWSGRAGDMLQSISDRVNEKVRILEVFRETAETLNAEFSDSTSEKQREPKRIVSSSKAFKNFLKCLNTNESSNND